MRWLARPLHDPADLDPLIERIGDARIVAIGEASHGTHEYYAWRAALTRRLIEERGFGVVAVEGDWPDCYRVNRSVQLRPGADVDPRDALDAFARWPAWMWANDDVVDFCRWLRRDDAAAAAAPRMRRRARAATGARGLRPPGARGSGRFAPGEALAHRVGLRTAGLGGLEVRPQVLQRQPAVHLLLGGDPL